MPLSNIQLLKPNTPNSLTALLQGGGGVLSRALDNSIQLGRDAVDKQLLQERSFLGERRSEINLAQRRGENAQKQENTDRAFGESVTRDRRDFNRSVLTQDRAYARGVFTSDRSFNEGVRQFNELDEDRDARLGFAKNADDRAGERHAVGLDIERDRKIRETERVEDRDFDVSERERKVKQREDAQVFLDSPTQVTLGADLQQSGVITTGEIAQREAAAKTTGNAVEAAKWASIREAREATEAHKRDLEILKAKEVNSTQEKAQKQREINSTKAEVDYNKAAEVLKLAYGDEGYDIDGKELPLALRSNTFEEFFGKGAVLKTAIGKAAKLSAKKKWKDYYDAVKNRQRLSSGDTTAGSAGNPTGATQPTTSSQGLLDALRQRGKDLLAPK